MSIMFWIIFTNLVQTLSAVVLQDVNERKTDESPVPPLRRCTVAPQHRRHQKQDNALAVASFDGPPALGSMKPV